MQAKRDPYGKPCPDSLDEKTDLNQICKYYAKICFLTSKLVANMVKATFATIFAHQCKCSFQHICFRFALEETYVCVIFAMRKFGRFGVNPFFRPVILQGRDFAMRKMT